MKLSVIVPTFNERGNIKILVAALARTLGENGNWEVIFVDDNSPDETYKEVQKLSAQWKNIRCLRRVGRRGLSSATIEGMLASSADFFVVIDGDMQHDETIIPKMLGAIENENLDLVVASRFIENGGVADGLSAKREKLSRFAGWLGRVLLKVKLSDPMSGFFMLRRDFFETNVARLSGIGFKILLDLIASSKRPVRLLEIPYKMRKRAGGQSKLTAVVVWEYLLLLIDKIAPRWIPVRFIMFLMVGASGIIVHLLVLKIAFSFGILPIMSQALATLVAMTTNYIFNNLFTYRDKKLIGAQFIRGLLSFYLACSIGVLINLAFFDFLFVRGVWWWLAGLAGAVISSIWNYGATRYMTWR